MQWIHYLIAAVLSLLGLACVLSTLVSLPGAWLIIALAAIIELCDGFYRGAGVTTFSMWTFVAAIAIALVGEGLEFAASAAGAKRAGASKRGMIGALIGGIIGAIAGTAIPIPIVGNVIGAALGAAIGAMIGELSVEGATFRAFLAPAGGAAAGRVAGTIFKLMCAVLVWVVVTAAVWWK